MVTDNDLAEVEIKLVSAIMAAPPFVDFIQVPNGPGETPNNGNWIRINSPINTGPFSQDASGCYEINRGFMVVQVFTPAGTGSQKAISLAQELKTLFTAELFDDVTIESVVVSPSPEPSGSPWFGVNCRINFTFEGYTA